MNKSIKNLLVVVFAFILIVGVFTLTKDRIVQNKIGNDLVNLQKILPTGEFGLADVDLNDESVHAVYTTKNNEIIFKISKNGYGTTAIEMLLAFDQQDNLIDILVLNHSETEGIGTKAFDAKYLQQLKDGKIELLSGATFTSGALTSAINSAKEHLKELH